jgi:hypothetical protein
MDSSNWIVFKPNISKPLRGFYSVKNDVSDQDQGVKGQLLKIAIFSSTLASTVPIQLW